MLHVCSVTLQYNVQNLCEKTDHYEANEKKKKNEESFKLFTKPRREMAITIKKKKNQTDLFLEKLLLRISRKKEKKWFNVTKYSRQKLVLEDILNSSFLRRKFKKEPTEFSIFFFYARGHILI